LRFEFFELQIALFGTKTSFGAHISSYNSSLF
jgi:hypothetical protein